MEGIPQTYYDKVIQACKNVFSELGPGFLEAVYQDALAVELSDMGVPFEKEKTLAVSYKGRPLPSFYRADFICYDSLIIELKAVARLVGAHKAQVINYMKATGKPYGLVVNFGPDGLRWDKA